MTLMAQIGKGIYGKGAIGDFLVLLHQIDPGDVALGIERVPNG